MTPGDSIGGNGPAEWASLDGETRALKVEQAKAEARREIAQADRAALDAALPATPPQPPEGTVSVSEASGHIAELVAFAAMTHCAEKVASTVPETVKTVLVIEDRDLIASDWAYLVVVGELTRHEKDLKDATEALTQATPTKKEGLQFAAGPAVASGVAASAASVVGMLRSDYTLTGRAVSIDSASLTAALVEHLHARNSSVAVDAFQLLTDSDVIKRLDELRREATVARLEAENLDVVLAPRERSLRQQNQRIAESESQRASALDHGKEVSTIDAELKDLRTAADQLEQEIAPQRRAVQATEKVLDSINAFVTTVTAQPTNGYPPVVAAAIRERLHTNQNEITHVLHATVTSAGGETVTRRNLWRSSITFVGGCRISYLLLDAKDGTLTGGHHDAVGSLPWDLKKQQPGAMTMIDL